MTTGADVSVDLLRRRVSELEREQVARGTLGGDNHGGDGNGPHMPDMNERIGKVEAAIEGVRHVQNFTLGVIGIVAAIGIAFSVYFLQRIDSLDAGQTALAERVADLPNKINANLLDLTKTLADSITAAKQTPPQVIILPAGDLRLPTAPAPEQHN